MKTILGASRHVGRRAGADHARQASRESPRRRTRPSYAPRCGGPRRAAPPPASPPIARYLLRRFREPESDGPDSRETIAAPVTGRRRAASTGRSAPAADTVAVPRDRSVVPPTGPSRTEGWRSTSPWHPPRVAAGMEARACRPSTTRSVGTVAFDRQHEEKQAAWSTHRGIRGSRKARHEVSLGALPLRAARTHVFWRSEADLHVSLPRMPASDGQRLQRRGLLRASQRARRARHP